MQITSPDALSIGGAFAFGVGGKVRQSITRDHVPAFQVATQLKQTDCIFPMVLS